MIDMCCGWKIFVHLKKIMEVVGIIEKVLAPIHDYKLLRDVEGINKSMALLKIVKTMDNEIF